MNNTLRGRIVEQYKTIKRFAEELGWSFRKAYDVVNGRQEATAKDIEAMSEALHVSVPEEFRALFLN